MPARAEEVIVADEIERGVSVFSQRGLAQGDRGWTPDDVDSSARLRLYRARASEQFVLSREGRAAALQAGIAARVSTKAGRLRWQRATPSFSTVMNALAF
jgi:hypothetical protein